MALTPYYDDGNGIVIYHGDCREILPHLPKVDLVLTDPPYGIAKKWDKAMIGKNGTSRLWGEPNEWDAAPIDGWLLDSAIRKGATAIIFGGNYYSLPPSNCWLIWDKVQSFSGADAELAWTNIDGAVRVFRKSRIDAYVNQARSKKEHPTEKPIDLMIWCIEKAPNANTILDPFMGSGTTLRAAKDLGRKCIGIEIEEKYCEIAVKRLAQTVLPL
jgi:DNA modification methylase